MMPSLWTAASGMTTFAKALDITSDNIANVSTHGFKTSRPNFANIFATTLQGNNVGISQKGHGVYTQKIQRIMTQGPLQDAGSATDAAISGRGFFKLRDTTTTTTANQYYFTRAGQFTFNANNLLVNPDGYVVQGYNVDPVTGVVSTAEADIDISGQYSAPQATTRADLSLNLDSSATVPAAAFNPADDSTFNFSHAVTVYDSNGVDRQLTTYYRRGSVSGQYGTAALTTSLAGADNDLVFTAVNAGWPGDQINIQYVDPGLPGQALGLSVSGNAITVNLGTDGGGAINSTAAQVTAAIAVDPAASALVTAANAPGDTGLGVVTAMGATNLAYPTTGSYWDWWAYIAASDAAVGSAVAGAAGYLSFDTNGQIVSAASAQTLNSFDFVSAAGGQAITFDFTPGTASAAIAPTSQVYGAMGLFYVFQDGWAQGFLQGVQVEDGGALNGLFSNGRTGALAYIALADFIAPDELKRIGDNLMIQTTAAGTETVGRALTDQLGQIAGGKLEQSNTDLAQEFVNLIEFQRSYQVNAKAITTSDQMLQEAIQLKR